ncbi:MAG TPA: hypothetical protein VF228_00125 [Iamia sp.]
MTRGVRPQGAEEVSVGERRRGIELVLDRQPEIDLDELQRILARVGIVVDTDTLVEDLDALGFDVDDDPAEAAGEPPAGPSLEKDVDGDEAAEDDAEVEVEDAEDPEAAPADIDEAGEADGEADAFAEPAAERRPSFVLPPPGADDDEVPVEGSWSRQSMMVVAAVVVVVIIVAVFLAGGSDDDGEDTTTGDGDTTETVQADGGTEATPTIPTEPVKVAPEGPGSDPALDVPETRTDDFERGDIGDFPDVGTWELLSGEWANTDGNLEVTGVPDDGFAVAAVDVASADVRAQVQVDRRSSRSGIAFRIVDERNFYIWCTVPEYATNILFEVVDGTATPVADSGLTATGDGQPALGVNLVGDRAELLNDGILVATYDGIGTGEVPTRIGVAALTDEEGLPLLDEFKVLTPPA